MITLTVLLMILLFAVGFLFGKPVRLCHLVSRVNPCRSYQESVRRVNGLRRLDGVDVSPDGRLVFLSHGDKVRDVIVFFHGNTNSPRQFSSLGKIFYDRGYNVLIPRTPHHGLKDRMTREHARMTALELSGLCDTAVDIARGLGQRITLVGFSMGANIAAWGAQNRSDVDKAVIIAPFWGWKGLPTGLYKPIINLLSILPNRFEWWSPKDKTALIGPTSSYYRFSTRGVAELMRLGWSVMTQAGKEAPKARAIVVITSAMDNTVNERMLNRVVREWRRHSRVLITRFQFAKSVGAFHDMIDPEQPYQKIAAVYPKLVELIAF